MTRKTRSQAKAKAKASASQRRDDDIGTGICEPIGTNHTCEVAITGIVRSAENDVPQTIRMVRFMTSESAAAGSVEHNCVVCNRPIDAERSLQCQTCSKFYHVECAKGSECSDQFTCESCVPRSSAPPPSSSCGRSSTSSTRRARLVRELALLEEERKLEEETRREQLDRERLMSERAAMEKIERDKQYLARKRDLLNQQDEEDEIVSIRSHHSARTTEKRIEDWIDNQAKSASDPGTGVVGETSKPCTPTHHTPVKSVGTHGQQCTSTPIRNEQTTSRDPFPIKAEPLNPIEIDLLSPTRTTGSITIGESDLGEAAGGNVASEINQISPPISLVNLNSLQNLLEEQKPTVKYTGTLPKLANNVLLPYGQWQVDTALRRKTNELEQRHQYEIATRRRRELDLVDEIKRLQLQKDSETDKFRKHEADTKKKLQEFSDRQTAMELRRHEELQQRDVEIRRLKDAERRLTDQLQVVSQKRQLDGAVEISPSSTTHMERQQSAPMNLTSPQLGNSTGTTGFRNDPPLVSSKSPYRNETNASIPRYRNDEHLPPKSSISNNVPSPHSDHYLPPLINHPAIPPATTTVGSQRLPGHSEVFCPSPEQLAARQVLSRELPTFNGDPLDWPLFFSSYINSTSACGYSEAENLLRLQQALQGPAKEAVSSFLLHPSTVPQVLSTLQILFGRPEQIVHIMIEKVRTTPPPKPERLETLISFGLVVQNLCAHLKAVGLNWHLSNPTLLQELVDKLPANVKFNWALYQQQLPVVDLDVFSEYMSRVTSAASSVTLTSAHQKTTKDDRPKLKEKAYINAHTTMERGEPECASYNAKGDELADLMGEKTEEVNPCPACKSLSHQAAQCSKFKELSLDARWNVVKEFRLCRRCLTSHLRWPCKGEVCGVNGCQKLHHRLLHYDSSVDPKHTEQGTNATVTIHRKPTASVLFRILPVTLYGKYGKVDTFAFLDDGTSVTLIENSIAESLGLEGRTESLCIQWTSGINKKISNAQMVQMEISALGSNKRFKVGEAYTVDGLGLPEQSLDFEQLAEQFQYLKKLPVQSFQSATPGILIGIDNAHLLSTLKLREGRMREPIATKTRIGWAVYGGFGGEHQFQHRQMHIRTRTISDDLHEYVHQFISLDYLGIAAAPIQEDLEEQRARKILKNTTIRTDCGKFETDILWKSNYVELPDSLPMAKRRLNCLGKRLQRNPELYEAVHKQIGEFQKKGYIHELSKQEFDTFDLRRTWYLPLNVVTNPNKPGNVRLIWDAAVPVDDKLDDESLETLFSTPSGILRRAVAKLAILDVEQEYGGFTEDDALL